METVRRGVKRALDHGSQRVTACQACVASRGGELRRNLRFRLDGDGWSNGRLLAGACIRGD
jgi:hypothetical protein